MRLPPVLSSSPSILQFRPFSTIYHLSVALLVPTRRPILPHFSAFSPLSPKAGHPIHLPTPATYPHSGISPFRGKISGRTPYGFSPARPRLVVCNLQVKSTFRWRLSKMWPCKYRKLRSNIHIKLMCILLCFRLRINFLMKSNLLGPLKNLL